MFRMHQLSKTAQSFGDFSEAAVPLIKEYREKQRSWRKLQASDSRPSSDGMQASDLSWFLDPITLVPIPLDSNKDLQPLDEIDNYRNEGELRDQQFEDGGFTFDFMMHPGGPDLPEFSDDDYRKPFNSGHWGLQTLPDDSDFGLFLNQVLDENPPWNSGNYARQMLSPYFDGWEYNTPEDFEVNMGNHLWWDDQSFLAPVNRPLKIELDIEWLTSDGVSDTNEILYPELIQGVH